MVPVFRFECMDPVDDRLPLGHSPQRAKHTSVNGQVVKRFTSVPNQLFHEGEEPLTDSEGLGVSFAEFVILSKFVQRLGYGMGTRVAFALEHGRCLPVQLFAFVKAPLEGIYPSLKCQSLGEFATARSVCSPA